MRGLIIAIMLVLCTTAVFAAQAVMPVEIEVSVDFDDPTDFTLYLPQGYERHFSWNANETHSDVTFDHTIYYDFEEEEWCTHSAEQAAEYRNISTGLSSMLSVCKTVVGSLDNSAEYQKQSDGAKETSLEYERLWTLCKADKTLALNDSSRWEDKYNGVSGCSNELTTCQSQLDSFKNTGKELNECKDDLDDSGKSKNNTMIFAALVGVGAGYFIWGRKKSSGPSEQAEAGYSGDGVEYREGPSD